MTDKPTDRTRFEPGEIVDITIKGARVEEPTDDQGNLEFTYSGDEGLVSFEGVVVPLADAVTVKRVAPPEWPPQIDDLWRDRLGILWFGTRDGSNTVALSNSNGTAHVPEYLTEAYGPLTLVHREGQDGGA